MLCAAQQIRAASSRILSLRRFPARGRPLPSQERNIAGSYTRREETKHLLCTKTASEVQELYKEVMDTRIPITVITGFLGSGKTTLLNRILTKNHGKRIAVIENEFGEIDIDSDLVNQKYDLEGTGDTIMMLNNGCLCCTVRDDLVKSLNALYERKDDFDHIIIETSGLANVSPIISTFYLADRLPERVRLDGVVTVVDVKHIDRHMDDNALDRDANEAMEQIAYADRIILNKTDLVEAEKLTDLESRVRKINRMASMLKTTYASVSLDYVLGIGGFDVTRVGEQLITPEEEHHHDHHDHHEHQHHEHRHDDAVTSFSLVIDGDLDLEKVNTVIGALVEVRGEDIFRMKGILSVQGWQERFVFQGVHMLFEGIPDRLWGPEEKRESKMVFIGKNLNRDDFEAALLSCKA